MKHNYFRTLRFLIAASTLATFVACSGGRQLSTTNTDPNSTLLNSGTGFGTGLGTGMGTSSLTSANTPSGSIFDQNLTPTEANSQGNSNLTPSTTDQMNACLTSNQALGVNSLSGTNQYATGTGSTTSNPLYSGGASPYCLSNTTGYDPSQALGLGSTQSYQTMDECTQLAYQVAPNQGDDPVTVQVKFIEAEMGMVRCYQKLLQFQQTYLPWGPGPQGSFGYNGSNLFQVLLILGNNNVGGH